MVKAEKPGRRAITTHAPASPRQRPGPASHPGSLTVLAGIYVFAQYSNAYTFQFPPVNVWIGSIPVPLNVTILAHAGMATTPCAERGCVSRCETDQHLRHIMLVWVLSLHAVPGRRVLLTSRVATWGRAVTPIADQGRRLPVVLPLPVVPCPAPFLADGIGVSSPDAGWESRTRAPKRALGRRRPGRAAAFSPWVLPARQTPPEPLA